VVDWDGVSGTQALFDAATPADLDLGLEGLVAQGAVGEGTPVYYAEYDDGTVDAYAPDFETDSYIAVLEGIAWTPLELQLVPSREDYFDFPGPGHAEAIILERRGAVGTMHFWDREGTTLSGPDALSPAVDTSVRVDSFVFLPGEFGVAYLTGEASDGLRDPGTLRVYVEGAGSSMTLKEDVVRALPLVEPFGLAYLVSGGEDAGIWFAKGR
jgi:hypothetical protein